MDFRLFVSHPKLQCWQRDSTSRQVLVDHRKPGHKTSGSPDKHVTLGQVAPYHLGSQECRRVQHFNLMEMRGSVHYIHSELKRKYTGIGLCSRTLLCCFGCLWYRGGLPQVEGQSKGLGYVLQAGLWRDLFLQCSFTCWSDVSLFTFESCTACHS